MSPTWMVRRRPARTLADMTRREGGSDHRSPLVFQQLSGFSCRESHVPIAGGASSNRNRQAEIVWLRTASGVLAGGLLIPTRALSGRTHMSGTGSDVARLA